MSRNRNAEIGDFAAIHHPAPSDVARCPRRIRRKNLFAHERMDAVRAHQHIAGDARTGLAIRPGLRGILPDSDDLGLQPKPRRGSSPPVNAAIKSARWAW